MTKTMMFLLAACFGMAAWGAAVTYVDEKGATQTTNATVVIASDSRVTWNAGWYVVTNDVTITGGANVNGTVMLILVDGAKLTIDDVEMKNAGIGVSGEGNSFAVYGQAGGTGELIVTGGYSGAGIGGGNEGVGSNITINGGRVTATGGDGGAGIGGGLISDGLNITLNGGTVKATGGYSSAGIGGGYGGAGSYITINGGEVTATGVDGGAGIGGGSDGPGSNIAINGGRVTAMTDYADAAIGCGAWAEVDASNIFVADNVILKAGNSPNPTEVIPHASPTTDIALLLVNKSYATAEGTYPGYLDQYGPAVKAQFDVWAATFGSRDPDGIHQNAFLLNVATNREAEAETAFKIGSIAITNEVVGAVTNAVVVLERAKPLAPSTTFNGVTWLQCATNGLNEAAWLDIESGRYTEGENSFFIQRIDFEHVVTPGAFPTEPAGGKTTRVRVE